ncbi:type IV toxin-antitoxin system AbiEi family antitoxin domain-containing protein [Magnetospira thiophila]
MAIDRYGLLKQVLTRAQPGQPLTAAWLAEQGVSAQLAYHYVQSGWLTRLGHGWFLRTGDEPELRLSLAALPGAFHVGGKTALAWYGFQHNLAHRPHTELFTDDPLRLPEWLTARFTIQVRRRRLFDDPTLCVSPWETPGLPVSEPERAVLEMLWCVPQHQSEEEAAQLVESLFGLRTPLMQALLESCRSVKAVRLFLHHAKQSSLPVLDELDLTHVRTGSATPYVRRHASGTIRI